MKKIIILLCMLTGLLQAMQQPVTVTFKRSPDGLRKIINRLRDAQAFPTLIVWFSGEDGLTQRSFDFYEKNLSNVQFCKQLIRYDLSAWKSLKDSKTSATETLISNECFPSYLFFRWLEQLTPTETEIVTCILQRDFIWEKSSSFCQTNTSKLNQRTLDQIIKYPEALDQFFKNKDTAVIYSALQYLEGLFLCITLIEQGCSNLIFTLPSGEGDYYIEQREQNLPVKRPASCEFRDDLAMLLSIKSIQAEPIHILFYEFEYRNKSTRPYTKCDSDIIICQPIAGACS